MEGADLAGANLQDADLRYADFEAANLEGANLRGSQLRLADFLNADLRSVHLREANIHNTSLMGANLDGAILGWTTISGVDLSKAKGLTRTVHRGPSQISINTIERTASGLGEQLSRQAEIESLFRNVGLDQDAIEYFRSRVGRPIQFYSAFISYSQADKSLARRLHDHLQAQGIRCWLDEHDLKPGDRILDIVNDAIRLHDRILLCCSVASLESWWVKDEIRKAQERECSEGRDIIIPLMVDRYLLDGWEDGLAADLRSRLAADFTGWETDNAKFEEQFERVVRALRTDGRERENAAEPKR